MDEKQKMLEEQQKKRARKKIDEINKKLKECDDVKRKLIRKKGKLDGEIDTWQSVQRKISSGTNCGKVVITDRFEGGMANGLRKHIADVRNDIKSGISAAEELSSEVQRQIDALENYHDTLSSQKSTWAAKL